MALFTMRWSTVALLLVVAVALCTVASASAEREVSIGHVGADGGALEWATMVDNIDELRASLLETAAESDAEHDAEMELDAESDAEMDAEIEAELDAEADAEVDAEAEAEVDAEAEVTPVRKVAAPVKKAVGKVAPKAVAAKKPTGRSTLTLKPVPKKTAAARLTAAEQQAKWAAFKKANPKKKYTAASEKIAFAAFVNNRAKIVAYNDFYATNLNPKPFKSSGPMSDLTPAQFKAKYLRTHRGSGKATVTAPVKKTVAKAKARFMQLGSTLESMQSDAGKTAGRAGTAAGISGGAAGRAGTAAGLAGAAAGRAGTAAGSAGATAARAGTAAGRAGTAAGDAGGAAARAGTAAGRAGTAAGNNKVIVQATAAQLAAAAQFAPFTGSVFNNPTDTTTDMRICRVVATIWLARYASTPAQRTYQFGSTIDQNLINNPMLLCTGTGYTSATVLALGANSVRSLLRSSYADLGSHPSNTPFTNKFVSSSDAALNQEQCGSCWAQAAIGSLEAALKKVNKYTGPLSVQQVIDCVKTTNSNGCAGGTPMDAIDYLKTHHAATNASYPYTGVQGACRTVAAGPTSFGWAWARPQSTLVDATSAAVPACQTGACANQWQYETDLIISVKTDGPYIIYVDATNWQNYGGGIYPPSQCSSTAEAANHVVELLGYAQLNGVPYWIVKNSWGPSWGESGNIWLPMGVNACGIANYVVRAVAL